MIKLSTKEQRLLDLLSTRASLIIDPKSIKRRSKREFDIGFSGTMKIDKDHTCQFSSWLPLAVIRHLTNWTAFAPMSDYPEMVASGDWSGIRDSSVEAIWDMCDTGIQTLEA